MCLLTFQGDGIVIWFFGHPISPTNFILTVVAISVGGTIIVLLVGCLVAKKFILSKEEELDHLELNKLESQMRKSDDKYIAKNQSGFEEENEIDNVQNSEEDIETDLKLEVQEDPDFDTNNKSETSDDDRTIICEGIPSGIQGHPKFGPR